MSACPSGWHIPSDSEWTVLVNRAGGSSTAGTKLKATSGWNTSSGYKPGTDDYSFAALPGGIGYSSGSFDYIGYFGDWWSSTENGASSVYDRGMIFNDEYVNRDDINKNYGLVSVRCVKD
ncbi:hypothetical protein R83H12_00380 [Fibrobacteria bacterium R8-3-H12]